jgi:hypothetical protein
VAASNDLTEFVGLALGRGIPRADVEEVLNRAGWSRDQAYSALASYADVSFPIPVPKPKAYLSAREAFLYLLLFGTLYISAFNVGALAFHFINRIFPDAVVPGVAVYERQAVRWALSSLIVSFPVFLYLSTSIARGVRLDPAKRRSNVRRWLMYLTIFVAASVLIGDVMSLIYNALGGELTIRFVLKALAVGTIAGMTFSYYLSDLRLEDTKAPADPPSWTRLVAWFAVLSVVAVTVAGLFAIGPPVDERARRLDDRRVEDLEAISRAADVYFERHHGLPGSLAALGRQGGLSIKEQDPLGAAYEYRITGAEAYELCATFERESEEGRRFGGFWSHEAGRQCYPLKIRQAQ